MERIIFLSLSLNFLNCAIRADEIPQIQHKNSSSVNSSRTMAVLEELLDPANYNNAVRPNGINGSNQVVVFANIKIRNVENIDDVQMEFSTQINFRQEWIDPRLEFAHLLSKIKFIRLKSAERLWLPDIMFSNEKSATHHELMLPNVFTRIYPNGKVQTSHRITLRLSCQMDLHYYPMDNQTCPIKMESYGWTIEDLHVKWREDVAVEISRGIKLPRFNLISFSYEKCPLLQTSSGDYDCLRLLLRFDRQFGYYLIQVYVPCFLLVIVSWVSFWLEPTAAEARISLCVTTILAVVTQAYGINQSVPPASYIKAIDVWTFTVQFMVFSSVLQFSYINYLTRFQWKKQLRNLNISSEDFEVTKEAYRLQGERKAKRIDSISKIVFPACFGIFNLIYWAAYFNPGMSSGGVNYED